MFCLSGFLHFEGIGENSNNKEKTNKQTKQKKTNKKTRALTDALKVTESTITLVKKIDIWSELTLSVHVHQFNN